MPPLQAQDLLAARRLCIALLSSCSCLSAGVCSSAPRTRAPDVRAAPPRQGCRVGRANARSAFALPTLQLEGRGRSAPAHAPRPLCSEAVEVQGVRKNGHSPYFHFSPYNAEAGAAALPPTLPGLCAAKLWRYRV